MFNRETKTVGNKLLSMKVPYDFQRGTNTETAICAMLSGAGLVSIEVRIMPVQELALNEEQDLVSQYVEKIEFLSFPDSAVISPVSILPTPKGFEEGQAGAITFTVSNKDPGSALEIRHQHFCLPYNDDFYLNVIGRYETSDESQFLKALEMVIQSRKLKRPFLVKEYYEIVEKEEKEAADFWRTLESEQQSKQPIENDDLDEYAEHEDDQQQEPILEQLLDELTNDFKLTETEKCVKGALKFSAKFEADEEVCGIEIELDNRDLAIDIIAEARSFLQKFDDLNKCSKQAIVDEMLSNYNNGWAEEGEQLTHSEFVDQLHSPVVHISEFDSSIFYDTKDDLFHGHSLFVEYERFKNFKFSSLSMIG